jgi:hypothetical protein
LKHLAAVVWIIISCFEVICFGAIFYQVSDLLEGQGSELFHNLGGALHLLTFESHQGCLRLKQRKYILSRTVETSFLSKGAAVVQGKSVKERKKMLLLEIIFHKNLKRKT